MALQCPQIRERLVSGKTRGEAALERAVRLGDDPEVSFRPECRASWPPVIFTFRSKTSAPLSDLRVSVCTPKAVGVPSSNSP